MVKIKLSFKPINEQQKNKILGTVFEKYVFYLLKKIFPDEILFQANVRNFVKKNVSKWYLIYFKSYFAIAKYDPIKYLYSIQNYYGENNFFSDLLKKRNYDYLKIVRLGRIIKLADAIIIGKEKIFLIDNKYTSRNEKIITNGDVLRLLCYKKIISETRNEKVEPYFIISSKNYRFGKVAKENKFQFKVIPISEYEKRLFDIEPEIRIFLSFKNYNAYYNAKIDNLDIFLHQGRITLENKKP